MIFIPEFLAIKAREQRDTFGSRSRGVPLRECPGSVLQYSTCTPGSEFIVKRVKPGRLNA